MPIALPTRKVAGSPTRVSRPAALLTMAVRIIGGTKLTSSACATRMITGASRITVVAFGRSAHTTATIATRINRKRRPLPPVARSSGPPTRSNMPVVSSTRATTMPPNSSASGPPADWAAARKSFSSRMPAAIMAHTPSSVATAMSITSKAITRMTAAKMPMVR